MNDNLTENKNNILLIDDDESLRKLVGYQFKSKGYNVVMACNGVEALDILGGFKPDLIILDLNMPKMGGIEFYNKVCDFDGIPKYPILILTARANTEELFKEFNIDGFISKPFDIDQLLEESKIILDKNYRIHDSYGLRELGLMRDIFIVDNDQEVLREIGSCFLGAGYKVATANSGTSGIEKIFVDLPELVLINLSLVDIPGDIVVERLKRMSKTSDINVILYMLKTNEHNKSVMDRMSKKENVVDFIEYSNVSELLDSVDRFYKKHKKIVGGS